MILTLEPRLLLWHGHHMAVSETQRHDLYNRLNELLGSESADTLMAYLPTEPASSLARKADVTEVGERVSSLTARLDRLEDRFSHMEVVVTGRIDEVNRRLDRLFLTLAAGLIAVVATMFANFFL